MRRLTAIILATGFSWAFSLMPTLAQEKADGVKGKDAVLECKVIVRERLPGEPAELKVCQVQLTNVSKTDVTIDYNFGPAPMEWFRHEVQWPDGTKRAYNCRDSLSPLTREPYQLTLAPGQSVIRPFGSIDGSKGPGTYRVWAHFDYRGIKCSSPPLEVQIK